MSDSGIRTMRTDRTVCGAECSERNNMDNNVTQMDRKKPDLGLGGQDGVWREGVLGVLTDGSTLEVEEIRNGATC